MTNNNGICVLQKDSNGILNNPWGEVYGYCRVSTKDQKLDRQLAAMLDYGVDKGHIFVEKESGKNFNRPTYKKLIRIIRKGDVIVIKSIDRLGRNYQDIIDQWRMITQDIGCGIHVIDMPTLNTSGDPGDLLSRFVTDMMLQVLSFVAENERENTLKRQREGIEAARKRGITYAGRPRIKMPREFWDIFIIWKTGEMKTKDLYKFCKKEYGMCQRTFYRRIRELDQRYGDLPPHRLKDLIVDEEFADGIEFSMERCEAAIGIYNSYTNDPAHERELRRAQKEREAQRPKDVHEEEEELKAIILEKRQAEFREKFGLEDPQSGKRKAKRNSRYTTIKQRQAISDAEKASTNAIKTVIID